MHRRHLLTLGLASSAALLMVGGAANWFPAGLHEGRLAPPARAVFTAVGRALLDGSLPREPAAERQALAGLLDRLDALIAALPPAAQAELSQLLSLLGTAPGRRGLAGLSPAWDEAPVPALQQALQDMRTSALALRQQAYQALHDLVGAAYFSDDATWPSLGYPGPQPV